MKLVSLKMTNLLTILHRYIFSKTQCSFFVLHNLYIPRYMVVEEDSVLIKLMDMTYDSPTQPLSIELEFLRLKSKKGICIIN